MLKQVIDIIINIIIVLAINMLRVRTDVVSFDDDPIPPLIHERRINSSLTYDEDHVKEDHNPIPPLIHERRTNISSIDDENHVEEDHDPIPPLIHEKRIFVSLDDDEDLKVIN